MCTNDLYLCKDSSRINCTLACSTLGYIPCRNYVDKKICSSVNKKHQSGRFFGLKSTSSNGGSRFIPSFFFDDDDYAIVDDGDGSQLKFVLASNTTIFTLKYTLF